MSDNYDPKVLGAKELLEAAWGIIANAGAGDWDRERPEWKKAAQQWRDDYFKSGWAR